MFRDEGWRGARKPASLGEGVNPFSARCLIIPPASLPGPVLRPELVDDGFLLLGEPGAGQDQFNRRIRFTPFSKHFPFRLTERARSAKACAADKESRGLALWRGAWGGGSPSRKMRLGAPLAGAVERAMSWAATFAVFSSANGSKESGLNLGAVGGGIGEHKASAEPEREAGGFQRVAAGRDVVHKIGLAERQGFAGAGQVVCIGRDGAKG